MNGKIIIIKERHSPVIRASKERALALIRTTRATLIIFRHTHNIQQNMRCPVFFQELFLSETRKHEKRLHILGTQIFYSKKYKIIEHSNWVYSEKIFSTIENYGFF